jgi:hypothetical protein
MALESFPGQDAQGFKDPTSIRHPVFASTAARDTWVTAQGGVAALQGKGFICIVDTGAAWSIHYLTIAGLWKTSALT